MVIASPDPEGSGKVAVKVTLQPVNCPQCSAPMTIAADQGHCRCEHCGSKFVIDWPDPDAPQLTGFESILAMEVDSASFEAAERRLTYLERAIADVEQEVEAKREQLEEAISAHQELKRECQRAISPAQNQTYAGGLLGLVAWLFVFFVLENVEWYVGLVIAIVLIFVARGFHRQWMGIKEQAQSELYDSRETVEQAGAGLSEALARQEDHILEQELCLRTVSNYQAAEETSA